MGKAIKKSQKVSNNEGQICYKKKFSKTLSSIESVWLILKKKHMYVQKVGNCEKKTCKLSKSYLKVYGWLNGTLVTSGGATPVKQIKSQVFLSSI